MDFENNNKNQLSKILCYRGHIFGNGMESFPLGLGSLADLFSGDGQKSTHDLDLFIFKLCSPEVITRGYNKNKFQKNSHLSNLFCRIMKFYSKIVDNNNNNNLSNDKENKGNYEIYNKILVSVADSISRILGTIFSVPCHPLALGVKFGLKQIENGFQMIDYSCKSMTEQAIAIHENQVSPTILLEQFFENIEKEPNSKNIFSEIFFKDAFSEAKNSEDRQKKFDPFLYKNIISWNTPNDRLTLAN